MVVVDKEEVVLVMVEVPVVWGQVLDMVQGMVLEVAPDMVQELLEVEEVEDSLVVHQVVVHLVEEAEEDVFSTSHFDKINTKFLI